MPRESHFQPLYRIDHAAMWARGVTRQVERVREAWRLRNDDPHPQFPLLFTECHLLLVSAENFAKAIDQLKAAWGVGKLDPSMREAIRRMRNVYEHWETSRWALERGDQRDLKKRQEVGVEANPFTIDEVGGSDDLRLCECIQLRELSAAAERVLTEAAPARQALETTLFEALRGP